MTDASWIIGVVAVIVAVTALAAMATVLWRSRNPAPTEDAAMAELSRAQADAAHASKARSGCWPTANRNCSAASMTGSIQSRIVSAISLKRPSKARPRTCKNSRERLAVIDRAQKNITDLATQVTSLQGVLANKQSRGAFGQWRMETIIQDGLPKGAYAFQYTLANKTRPDCCIFLPDRRPLVIDAKFPLEGITAYRDAKSDDERKAAAQRLRADVSKHVTDIAEKYLIPGETQEIAFMFVPSESVYADLHDGFDDLVQKAYRAHVVVVSPSILMLAIQVVQQIQKDARMREAADQIRDEVGRLVKDVSLLGDRVRRLQTHFNQSNEDIRQAIISIDKIEAHGERIQQVELGAQASANSNVISAPVFKLEAGE